MLTLRCLKGIGFTGLLIMHGLEEEDFRFSREFLERIATFFNIPLSMARRWHENFLERDSPRLPLKL